MTLETKHIVAAAIITVCISVSYYYAIALPRQNEAKIALEKQKLDMEKQKLDSLVSSQNTATQPKGMFDDIFGSNVAPNSDQKQTTTSSVDDEIAAMNAALPKHSTNNGSSGGVIQESAASCNVVDYKTYDEIETRQRPVFYDRTKTGWISGGGTTQHKVTYLTVTVQNRSDKICYLASYDITVHTVTGADVHPVATGIETVQPGETVRLSGMGFPDGLAPALDVTCKCR